jgi:hypothetical protein
MSRRSIFALPVLLATACGPEVTPPGASGQISLLPGNEATGFTHAQIRLGARENDAKLGLEDVVADSQDAELSLPIDELPLPYEIVHDSESSDVATWQVTVWLSTTADATTFANNDLFGEDPFELADCTAPLGEETYCGTQEGVDVVIDTRITF